MAIVEGNVSTPAVAYATRPHPDDFERPEDRDTAGLGSFVEDHFCDMLWNPQHVIVLRILRKGFEIFRFDFIVAGPDYCPLQLDTFLDEGVGQTESLERLVIEVQLVSEGLQNCPGRSEMLRHTSIVAAWTATAREVFWPRRTLSTMTTSGQPCF